MKQLLLILTCFLTLNVYAEQQLTFLLKSGEEHNYLFSTNPTLSFTDDKVVVTSEDGTVQFEMENVEKFYFATVPTTGIDNADSDNFMFSFINNVVFVKGCKFVELYSIDGRMVMSEAVNGSANISLENQTNGIYLLKTDVKTIKLIKK